MGPHFVPSSVLENRVGLAVTGIAPGVDTSAIEQALRGANLSLELLSVISSEEGVEGVADSGIRFVYSGSDAARSFLGRGTSGITSFGGTDVPGMSGSGESQEYFRRETLSDELGDLEIPDSELGNYL